MDINKEIMTMFFTGELTPEQSAEVIAWAKESDENYATLESERRLFDLVNLSDDSCFSEEAPKKLHFLNWKRGFSIAAGLAAVLAIALFVKTPGISQMTAETSISAPAGGRSLVTLPDGSEVWLNSGSTMTYSSNLANSKLREVKLDGQARFEVAKDEKHPFIVHTYLADVEVLGTSFDLIADESRNIFETALFTGSVSVSAPGRSGTKYVLSPSQKLVLDGNKLEMANIIDNDIYQWIDGLYCFKDRSFANIVTDMEKYYNVKIDCNVDSQTAKEKLTGKFRITDGLDFALRVLQISLDFDYAFDQNNEKVTIRNR